MTGILPIDKEPGITSFGVVAKVRGITRQRKAGHAGTLDPMATGVLPILLGGATRFLSFLPDQSKGYLARFRLGMTTDTLDITGKVLSQSPVCVTRAQVEQALSGFRGETEQLPPMYSAISKDGVRLYELARQGIEVEREHRRVLIETLELVTFDEASQEYEINVVCSKGTYIRSLIDDLGRCLGCGAVMTALRRTMAAGFLLKDCLTLAQAQEIRDQEGDFSPYLISVEEAFSCYEKLGVTAPQANRFANGGFLDLERVREVQADGFYRVYGPEGSFLGLGQADRAAGQLAVARLLTGC